MTDGTPARLVRAMTDDQFIRMATIEATPLWDGVRRGHPHLEAEACACLTELLAATALLQSRSGFAERLQLLVKGAGRARAVVTDSWPDGTLRGVLDLKEPDPGGAWIQDPGAFQVMRSNPDGQPYIGTLPMVEGGIGTQVEAYLQQSEQVNASITLWCDPASGDSGGLLVEPLPGCPPERLALLVQALDGLEVVPAWERTPEFLMDWINQGPGAEILSAADLDYRCRCTREGLLNTLQAFPLEQKRGLFEEDEVLQVRCDYCGKLYPITKAELLP
ncbi:MAG TPA: Hsp33 family molecular chaperone HslO [Holophagaceae bacterium]|nr:Hsp33 family molecular chaperone HslO [Holophagaceae bacterium]